ncbi:hypothetical protein BRADI_3g33005v3 [Brachypodium distachyon]|uniref:Uncharacterized protein n=1 Tax=Brachypodium distachyon TaxID=15368 RepID=A0A2K2D0Q9_BRADI|nr:hypothetical protein BRADI_3g33005v3 [Brachypodium distachyon]
MLEKRQKDEETVISERLSTSGVELTVVNGCARGARRGLDLVDDEEAGQHGAAVEDDELAAAHVDGVVLRLVMMMMVSVVVRSADAPRDDAAHQHRPSARGRRRRGRGARVGVGGAAAGEGADRGAGRAEAAGGHAGAEDASRAGARGGPALEAHHLVAVGAAARRRAVRAGGRPGLLEPRHCPRRAVHPEHRLHLRRRVRGGPPGREDQLHHPPRRVATRQLRHRQERRASHRHGCSALVRLSRRGLSCVLARRADATVSLTSAAVAHETAGRSVWLFLLGDGATAASATPYDLQLRDRTHAVAIDTANARELPRAGQRAALAGCLVQSAFTPALCPSSRLEAVVGLARVDGRWPRLSLAWFGSGRYYGGAGLFATTVTCTPLCH